MPTTPTAPIAIFFEWLPASGIPEVRVAGTVLLVDVETGVDAVRVGLADDQIGEVVSITVRRVLVRLRTKVLNVYEDCP